MNKAGTPPRPKLSGIRHDLTVWELGDIKVERSWSSHEQIIQKHLQSVSDAPLCSAAESQSAHCTELLRNINLKVCCEQKTCKWFLVGKKNCILRGNVNEVFKIKRECERKMCNLQNNFGIVKRSRIKVWTANDFYLDCPTHPVKLVHKWLWLKSVMLFMH